MSSRTSVENNHFDMIFGSKARTKILRILAMNEELTLSQVMKKTKLNYTSVHKHLSILVDVQLIQEKKFGKIKIYRFRLENTKAKSFKTFLKIWETK